MYKRNIISHTLTSQENDPKSNISYSTYESPFDQVLFSANCKKERKLASMMTETLSGSNQFCLPRTDVLNTFAIQIFVVNPPKICCFSLDCYVLLQLEVEVVVNISNASKPYKGSTVIISKWAAETNKVFTSQAIFARLVPVIAAISGLPDGFGVIVTSQLKTCREVQNICHTTDIQLFSGAQPVRNLCGGFSPNKCNYSKP